MDPSRTFSSLGVLARIVVLDPLFRIFPDPLFKNVLLSIEFLLEVPWILIPYSPTPPLFVITFPPILLSSESVTNIPSSELLKIWFPCIELKVELDIFIPIPMLLSIRLL
jgi:hypothetical protein